MSRINTNVLSLIGQRILGQQNQSLSGSLERLSTGLAINRGSDGPAALIASENLRSEITSLGSAISNAERADQVINIAEGGLQEVSSLLLELQGLIGESANTAGLSTEEKEANQLQVDSIIQTIDRISSATSFQGSKLLNGTFDYTITSQATTVADYSINAAKLGFGETRDIDVVVTASAQHAALFLSTNGALNLTDSSSVFTFELAGAEGSREFSFASGTTLADITTAVNTFKSVTGVSAATQGTGILLKSTKFGTDEFVSFDVSSVGGQAGAVHAVSSIDEDVVSTTAGAQAQSTVSAFTISGGGAKFSLGPNVDIASQVNIGIKNTAARYLGDITTGYIDDLGSGNTLNVVDGNLEDAQIVVNAAIDQVSKLRGRLGAFQQNTIGATIRSLSVALENSSAAESSIRDTDFAAETAQLTRSQILVNAATTVLSISNQQPQSVLALLG